MIRTVNGLLSTTTISRGKIACRKMSPPSPGFQQLLVNQPVLNVSNLTFDYSSNDTQTDRMAVDNTVISGHNNTNSSFDNDVNKGK